MPTPAYTNLDSNKPAGSDSPTTYATDNLANIRALRDMVITGRAAGFVQTRTQGAGPDVARPQYITWLNSTLQVGFRMKSTWGGTGNCQQTSVEWEWTNDNGASWTTLGTAQANTFDANDNITATTNSGGFVSLVMEMWTKLLRYVGAIKVDAATNNVGIGTSSPSYRLSVKQSGNTSTASLGITSINSANDTFIGLGYDATSDTNRVFSSYVSTGAYKPITFWTTDTERMRIDSSGNVGIGTSSPTGVTNYGALTINGTTGSFIALRTNGTDTAYLQSNGSSFDLKGVNNVPMILFTNNTERMRISSGGNVGINASSPDYRLTVVGTGTTSTSFADTDDKTACVNIVATVAGQGSGGQLLFSGLGGATPFAGIKGWVANGTGPAGDILFQTRGTSGNLLERMRVDSFGNVGIGTSPSYTLHVSTSGQARVAHPTEGISYWSLQPRGSNYLDRIVSGTNGAIQAGANLIFETNGANERLRITDDGRLYGTALHNNAGSVTGTTNQYIASGTYTPTIAHVFNITTSTAYACQWMRVGNVVTVSGRVYLEPTSSSGPPLTRVAITLPIASALTASEQLSGASVATQGSSTVSATIEADTAQDRAFLSFYASSVSNCTFTFTFTYVVL